MPTRAVSLPKHHKSYLVNQIPFKKVMSMHIILSWPKPICYLRDLSHCVTLNIVYTCCSIATSCLWPQAWIRAERPALSCMILWPFVLNCQAVDHMARLPYCWQRGDVTCLSVNTADTNKQASDIMMKFWSSRVRPREITVSHGILRIFRWTSAAHLVAVECLHDKGSLRVPRPQQCATCIWGACVLCDICAYVGISVSV